MAMASPVIVGILAGVLASSDELLDFLGVWTILGEVPWLITPIAISESGVGRLSGRRSDSVPIGPQVKASLSVMSF